MGTASVGAIADPIKKTVNPASGQPDPVSGDPGELTFLAQLAAVVRDLSLSEDESRMVRSFRRIGLSMSDDLPCGTVNLQAVEKIREGLRLGETAVRRKTRALGRQVNGWSINYQGPRFGKDSLLPKFHQSGRSGRSPCISQKGLWCPMRSTDGPLVIGRRDWFATRMVELPSCSSTSHQMQQALETGCRHR
jgi:hypothetical protein